MIRDNWTIDEVATHAYSDDDIKGIALLEEELADDDTKVPPTLYATPSMPTIYNNPSQVKTGDILLSSFLKQVHVTCNSIEHFPNFYRSLHTHGKNYNIHLVAYDDISAHKLSQPAFRQEAKSYLESCMHSILSKHDVFPMSFAEGRATLSMSNNGYDVLDILLGKVHPNLKDK